MSSAASRQGPNPQNFQYLLLSSNPLFLTSVRPVQWAPAPFNPPFLPFTVSHWRLPPYPFKLSMLKHLELARHRVVVWKCLWGAVPFRLVFGAFNQISSFVCTTLKERLRLYGQYD